MPKKYRIADELIHKTGLNKSLFSQRILSKHSVTDSWAGTFFHYTSPEGLIGILKNRNIYFTDCQYLNDYSERVEINTELDRFWLMNSKAYDKQFRDLLISVKISLYEDSDFAYIDGSNDPTPCRYFILSASRKADSLDMWKYYAKNGTYDGYYINLNTYALTDEWIDRDTSVAVEDGDAVYSIEQKQRLITETVEKLYDPWCRYQRSPELDEKIHSEFRCWVSYASLFFKNSCFEQEEEYRFIAIAPISKLSALTYGYRNLQVRMYDFRVANGVITPFIRMPLCLWNKDECWSITQIGIGPSHNRELKEKGIYQFIASLDYNFGKIDITQSKIPLRY